MPLVLKRCLAALMAQRKVRPQQLQVPVGAAARTLRMAAMGSCPSWRPHVLVRKLSSCTLHLLPPLYPAHNCDEPVAKLARASRCCARVQHLAWQHKHEQDAVCRLGVLRGEDPWRAHSAAYGRREVAARRRRLVDQAPVLRAPQVGPRARVPRRDHAVLRQEARGVAAGSGDAAQRCDRGAQQRRAERCCVLPR